MKLFIFLTGLFNLLFGITLQFPIGVALVLPKDSSGMTSHLFGITASLLGVLLIISARDLKHRGVLVVWEGILRIFGFLIMAYYAIWGGYDARTLILGCTDGLIGVAYLILIPRYLGSGLVRLLLDSGGANAE